MMKKFLVFVLGFSLIAGVNLDSFAAPPSGGGSTTRGYSSGGGSTTRGYSSGGGSTTRGYSSGGGSTTRGYSSGGSSTKPPAASSSRPVTPGGSKGYSSGGGSKSYSSGTPPSSVAPRPSIGTYTPGKSYSSGNSTYSPVISSSKPKGGVNYDGNAAAAQKRAESKANYVRGPESKKTYTTPTGNSATINTSSGSYRQVSNITHETYITRDVRINTFYSSGYIGVPYYSRPIIVYNDPYNSLFWYWLLDRNIEQQAMWAYCHRADMDAARYNALLARDANLAARVRALEAQKAAVDPTYVPPGVTSPDLMYTDDYVDSVVNPHVVQRHPASAAGRVLFWIFMVFLGIIVSIVLYSLVFVKKW